MQYQTLATIGTTERKKIKWKHGRPKRTSGFIRVTIAEKHIASDRGNLVLGFMFPGRRGR
jgi:hypothetical protein